MLSAHIIQPEEDELKHLFNLIKKDQSFDATIAWQVLTAFALGLCDIKLFRDSMNGIRHKKDLELAKKSLILILESDLKNIFSLLVALDNVKDSVMLALGNQICYLLKNQYFSPNPEKPEIIEKVLKKMTLLNYFVSKENEEKQNCEFRDIWNVISVLEKFTGIFDLEVPQLAKFIDLERDFMIFKTGASDCFCRHVQVLTLESKRQFLQTESKSIMRQELQVNYEIPLLYVGFFFSSIIYCKAPKPLT
jgi:hypothetical protein